MKKEVVYSNGKPYAFFKKSATKHDQYSINSLDCRSVINIDYSHLDDKGKQGYIVTFLNDNKLAMIYKQAGFPLSFIKEVVKADLVNAGEPNSGLQHYTPFLQDLLI